jgi:cytochrome b561
MAVSGALYYLWNSGNPDAGGVIGVIMFVHTGLANLVWAYLFGHAGMALLHHYTLQQSLGDMWSLRGTQPTEGKTK